MTNAELIAGLRECATVGDCNKCKMHDEYSYDMCAIKLILAAADALEAAEKRIAELEAQLPKEGEWIDANGADVPLDKDGDTTDSCYCSICGDWLTASDEYATRGRYCPNCGAKMRGEHDERTDKA